MLPAGVAAGHPATVEAGIAVLDGGGSAADAAVAASLASCVAETVMTGLLGGGHGIYFDSDAGRAWNLDCFVAVPGLGATWREPDLELLPVLFGEELVHYAVGPGSCAVPGLPAGLAALWERFGRLPWTELVEPALTLARDGVSLPPAHAACLTMLAPVMTMNEGAEIYSPGGHLLAAGDVLRQPGLARAVEIVAEEGALSVYSGTLAEALLGLLRERGGTVTADDLEGYEPRWDEPVETAYLEARFLTRGGLAGVAETLPRLPLLRGLSERERVLALVDALRSEVGGPGDTTNLVAVDADGSACVLTTSLGLGSGDFLPGLDLHLNSMLGEADLVRGPLRSGARMDSMMAPSLALDGDELVLAAGAAGGTRLRTALATVVAGVLDERLEARVAVERPRVHDAGAVVNAEPGVDEEALRELEGRGRTVRRWPEQHHYFGGVSLVTPSGAAGDPRRSGGARLLRGAS
jgi:gamma-glutamyltranspeptidase / glutathione hydrolase